MKKHILLTTTAMLLSAISLKANAGSNSVQINMQVAIREPFHIITNDHISFGIVLGDEPGKTVIVTTDGKLAPESTAALLSQKNSDIGFPLHEGKLIIKNSVFKDLAGMSEDELNAYFSVVGLDGTSVNMMDTTSLCGTVSDFTTRFKHSAEGEVTLHIGGTFTTSDVIGAKSCDGYTTATIVLNDEYWQSGR